MMNGERTVMNKNAGYIEPEKTIDHYTLKWIASIFMLVDHFAYAIIYCVFLSGRTGTDPWLWGLYRFMRGAGRIAFPLYIYMLADGFFYTRNRMRYLDRLIIFSLISEIPFDMAFNGTLQSKSPFFPEFSSQNVFFTLALGFGAMWIIDGLWTRLRNDLRQGEKGRLESGMRCLLYGTAMAAAAGAAFWAAWIMKTDYKYYGVMAILTAWALRHLGSGWLEMAGIGVTLTLGQAAYLIAKVGLHSYFANRNWTEIYSLLAVFIIIFYNGRKGRDSGVIRWGFYLFYPVHLLVLAFLAAFIQDWI